MAVAGIRPTTGIDLLGLPELPDIPEIMLCLHFPGSEGWNKHWRDFNKKVKEFHQAMIDFNWRMLEWYALKSRQLHRFGMRCNYIAGTLISVPRMTIIYTKTISEGDAISEVKKLLPDPVRKDVIQLEKVGYKLILVGKIFIFNNEKVIIIDHDMDGDKSFYRNCLKFTLYDKNEKVNIVEAYSRVYGGIRSSFVLGGIGGLVVSLITGYYDKRPTLFRGCKDENLLWLLFKRWVLSSVMYTITERILLLKFTQPRSYVVSGWSGAVCGLVLGLWDKCDPISMILASVEFGLYSFLCNIFFYKRPKIVCKEEDHFLFYQ